MRYYSSSAVQTSLAGNISSSATTINVASVAGFPVQYPYTLSVDADNANKELIEVTGASGTTLTVVRSIDGTAGVAHSMGAVVSHDHSARDFRESRDHEAATAAHGATGAVVGTTNTQTLTNKDLSAGSNVFPASLTTDTELASGLAGKSNTGHTHPLTDITGTSGLATLTGTQTLTNKTLTDPVSTSQSRNVLYIREFPSKAALDATTTYEGAIGIVTGANPKTYQYNGGAWVQIAGAPTWVSLQPNLSLGWAHQGAPYQFLSYTKVDGVVTVRGVVEGGLPGTVFTMPAGARPAASQIFLVSAGSGAARLSVDSDGVGYLLAYIAGGGNSFVSCDFSFAAA